jgi:hypothetical protein
MSYPWGTDLLQKLLTELTSFSFCSRPSVALYTSIDSLSLARYTQYNLSDPIYWVHINITLIPIPVPPNDLFVSGFHSNITHLFHFSPTRSACPSNLTSFKLKVCHLCYVNIIRKQYNNQSIHNTSLL